MFSLEFNFNFKLYHLNLPNTTHWKVQMVIEKQTRLSENYKVLNLNQDLQIFIHFQNFP